MGLIPAWAGKTAASGGPTNPGGGSSPRGRGKPRLFGRRGPLHGLIPAWAGKTSPADSPSICVPAHPRVGGENAYILNPDRLRGGSSPRGRGKPALRRAWALRIGLIPAWAGKTPALAAKSPKCAAHPRVGGENPWTARSVSWVHGSSPRGRGKPFSFLFTTATRGLIPAWAGKTWIFALAKYPPKAHPRVGGEN